MATVTQNSSADTAPEGTGENKSSYPGSAVADALWPTAEQLYNLSSLIHGKEAEIIDLVKGHLSPEQLEMVTQIKDPAFPQDQKPELMNNFFTSLTSGQEKEFAISLRENNKELFEHLETLLGPGPGTAPEAGPATVPPLPGKKPALTESFSASADADTPRPAITLSGRAVASVNEDVRRMQEALIESGYDLGPGKNDGKEGPLTRAAVKKYAQDTGQDPATLTAEGIVRQLQEAQNKPDVAAVETPGARAEKEAGPLHEDPKAYTAHYNNTADGPPPAAAVTERVSGEDPKAYMNAYNNTFSDTKPGTQIMVENPETGKPEIRSSATGNTPDDEFGKAASGKLPENMPVVAPDVTAQIGGMQQRMG